MASSDNRRRKHDPHPSPITPAKSDILDNAVFTSARWSSQSYTIRARSGSHGTASNNHIKEWANAWRPEEDHPWDIAGDDPPSTPTSTKTLKALKGHLPESSKHQSSHPLASSQSFDLDQQRLIHRPPLSERSRSSGTSLEDLLGGFNDGLSAGKGKGKQTEDTRTVIEHEVQPADSLAGVALKYGVELADLRKFNKLWSSDSIHLRKFLYIPVDSRKWGPKYENLIDFDDAPVDDHSVALAPKSNTPPPMGDILPHKDNPLHPPGHSRNGSGDCPATPPKLRRVPASELSFFPPPSTPPSSRRATNADATSNSPLKFQSLSHATRLGQLGPFGDVTSGYDPFTLPSFPSLNSARGVPSLLSIFSSPSSRVSFSSEADTEASDEPDVELVSADGWTRSRRARPSQSNQDRRPHTLGPKNPIATDFGPLGNPNLPRVIRTQQPTPSPQMELPTRSRVP